jgi:3-isopropylmalate dehydrogenase
MFVLKMHCAVAYKTKPHRLNLLNSTVLFGAIGDPKYDNDPEAKVRPEQGLLRLRKELGLLQISDL